MLKPLTDAAQVVIVAPNAFEGSEFGRLQADHGFRPGKLTQVKNKVRVKRQG